MDDNAKLLVVAGTAVTVGVIGYVLWSRSKTAVLQPSPTDTVIAPSPSSINPSNIPSYMVEMDQIRLNAIAAKNGWSQSPLNGVINDPAFTSALQQFQTWFNKTYTPTQAQISGTLNTNGILDADTSGALIYVYGAGLPQATPTA